MISELATISLLQDSIAKKLGPEYLVNMNALTSSLARGQEHLISDYRDREMDLVIWGPDKNKPFIVEFKSLRKGIGVPLSSVPLLIDLVDRNPGVQPHLIFATNGLVGPLVRDELQRRNIDVIESESLSEMTAKITDIIFRESGHIR